MSIRSSISIPWRWGLIAAALLFLALLACRPETTLTPAPEATPTPVPQVAPEDRQALALLVEGAGVVRSSYVATGTVTVDALVNGGIQGMLELLEVPPYPFLTRLSQVQGPLPTEVPRDLADLWRAWHLLVTEHPDVERMALAHNAILGMLQVTGDEEAQLLLEGEWWQAQEFLSGIYEGIGAIVQQAETGQLVVTAVVTDGPADRAGLLPGDIILAVDGESTAALSLPEVVQRLKGVLGTKVLVTLLRGRETPRNIAVTRERISLPTVATDVLEGGVGYMLVARFAETTRDQVRDALDELLRVPIKALILDLRGNSGGAPQVAVNLVSLFVESGLVYYQIDNAGQRKEWPVEGNAPATRLPMAVIVNGQTASIAEVVAGALQEHGRARVFGATTFGKGTLADFQRLSDGSSLYVMVGRWYTPQGRSVQGTGLKPDVAVELSQLDIQQNQDWQLQEAFNYLRSTVEASEGTQ